MQIPDLSGSQSWDKILKYLINVLSDNLIHASNIFMSVSPCDSKISMSSNGRTGIDPPKLRNYKGIF